MFSISITRETRNLEKLVEKMERLAKEKVETGVFIEQGEHPTANMTYVELARMHEEGDGDFPPRTVRNILLNKMKDRSFVEKAGIEVCKHLLGDYSDSYALSKVGEIMSSMGKSFFGKVSYPDMPTNSPYTIAEKGFNAPLVDEGYLRDAWAYKTSISDYIVDSNYV